MPIFRRSDATERRLLLERMIVDEFAHQGVRGDLVRDPDDPLNTSLIDGDRVFGFGNLMLFTLAKPRRRWSATISRHVSAILHSDDDADLGRPDARARLRARIMPEGLRASLPLDYAVPYAPDLIEVLCLDLPDRVDTLSDAVLAGHSVEELRQIGRANLEREAIPAADEIAKGVFVIAGDSLFTASQLLRPEFVAGLSGQATGVVVAIPDRHTIVFHPVHGADSIEAVTMIAQIGSGLDPAALPGGLLSPHAFFVSTDGAERITELTPEGDLSVVADGAFLSAIDR